MPELNSNAPPPQRKPLKPKKPYPDFPLFPHATRRWAKKICGKMHYFGPWDDPDAALKKYLEQRDELHAGRTPRAKADGLTVRELLNRFLTSKQNLVDTGELEPVSFFDYKEACRRVAESFGLDRLVLDLAADDFQGLRKTMAKTWGPVRLGAEIQRTRTILKYGFDAGLIGRPVRYGPSFVKPSIRVLRKARADAGENLFKELPVRKAGKSVAKERPFFVQRMGVHLKLSLSGSELGLLLFR